MDEQSILYRTVGGKRRRRLLPLTADEIISAREAPKSLPAHLRDGTHPQPALGAFLTSVQAAAFLALSPVTLAKWRLSGMGPPFRKFGQRRVAYSQNDLTEWAVRQLRHSTSEAA